MMTSRSEYRLLLRQDNADERLVPIGAAVGLNSPARLARTQEKYARVQTEIDRLAGVSVQPTEAVQAFLTAHRSTPLKAGCRLIDLMRRPELSYDDLAALDPGRPALDAAVREQVEIRIQYEGYIARQQKDVEQFRRLEARALPADLDYNAVPSLRLEARQKLNDIRPLNFGQAGRISGVSPADMTALMIYLNTEKGGGEGMTARELLAAGLETLHQNDPQAVDKLLAFSDLLLEKNKVMNLTAVTDPMEVVTRHFLDCAPLAPYAAGKDVVDVGCGAGFPGVPLAILTDARDPA